MNPLHRTAALFALVSVVGAAPALGQERAWLDVNFGIASAAEDTYTDSVTFPFRIGTAEAAAIYSLPSGASFDVGGGYMFHPRIGAGISIAGAAHEDTADLRVSIPHPFLVGVSDTATASTDDTEEGLLRRGEGSIHLQVMAIVTDPTAPLSVRVFGGPTYFRVRQDTVDDLIYSEFVTAGGIDVELNEYVVVEEVEANGWGFHGGVDVRYFFTERLGVGGIFRFSRGEVEIPGMFGTADDPPPPLDIKVGGVQFGGGLRVRF